MRFDGINAIVTGAASGIGRATAHALASEGATVGVIDLDAEGATSIADSLEGPLAIADISDSESAAAAIDSVASGLGGLQVLVNCAGWDRAMPFSDTDPSFWDKVIGINLLGTIAVSHAALEHLDDGGAIVNVASDAGRVGSTGEVVYSAAKGGVIAFTKALAREVARRSIRANCVAPGPTRTPLLESFDSTGRLSESIVKQTPLRKLASPEEIAAAICFLASADASHITGQVLSVSGGLTMV